MRKILLDKMSKLAPEQALRATTSFIVEEKLAGVFLVWLEKWKKLRYIE